MSIRVIGMQGNSKALRVGNGWFVAAASASLALTILFSWASFVLAEELKYDSSDYFSQETEKEAMSLTFVQKAMMKREVERNVKLKRVLGSGLRVGQFGFGTVFLLISIGYVRRLRAIGAESDGPQRNAG